VRFDLQHPAPGVAEVLGQVEIGKDLLDLLTAGVHPDVVPLRIAQQVGDDPGALFDRAVPQQMTSLLRRDLLVGEEVERFRAVGVASSAGTLHGSSIAGWKRFTNRRGTRSP